jgi:hypothetical protein
MPRIVPQLNLPSPSAGLHPRLRTAFSFLAYCESITSGRGSRGLGARDLIAGEVAARNAALELLRNYMTGEMVVDDAASEPVEGDPDSPAASAGGLSPGPGEE